MASAEEYERQLYLRYGKVQWENIKRNYLRENIRQDIENYCDLVVEERELYRELKMAREREEEELIEDIQTDITENYNIQLDVLANIKRCKRKIENILEGRLKWILVRITYSKRIRYF